MAIVSLRLDSLDLDAIAVEVEKIVSRAVGDLELRLRTVAANDNRIGQGVRVVTVAELARRLGKSIRQIYRMEREGRLPRRIQISLRRVGFLLHEVDGIPVDAVAVTDRRALTCEELAAKLSVHTLTVGELVASAELPPSNDRGEWPEQEIDRWLLSRPRA